MQVAVALPRLGGQFIVMLSWFFRHLHSKGLCSGRGGRKLGADLRLVERFEPCWDWGCVGERILAKVVAGGVSGTLSRNVFGETITQTGGVSLTLGEGTRYWLNLLKTYSCCCWYNHKFQARNLSSQLWL